MTVTLADTRRLLKTNLSDLERRFLERRLSEERSAVESLAHPAPIPRTGTGGQFDDVCIDLRS
jgi:hypothetical protein